MYSPMPYSSIPFCDHTLPHHHQSHHRASSHSSSPLPAPPHRACFRQQNQDLGYGCPLAANGNPPIEPKPLSSSSTREYPARISSRRQFSNPLAPCPTPIIDLQLSRQRTRLGPGHSDNQRSFSASPLVLSNGRVFKPPLGLNDYDYHPSSHMVDSQDAIDRFLGQPVLLNNAFIKSRKNCSNVTRDEDEKENRVCYLSHHRKASNLPQMPLEDQAVQVLDQKPNYQHTSRAGSRLEDENYVSPTIYPPILQPSPSIRRTAKPLTQPKPRPSTSSVPLRLFPTSPTNSVNSNGASYNQDISSSPINSTFHPSAYLQQPVSVFEYDEEKMGLMDYFRWPLQGNGGRSAEEAKRTPSKRGGWRRIFCYSCG